jgi:hemerythrin superfamily protein
MTTDAIQSLTDDHHRIELLFGEYEDLVAGEPDDADRRALVQRICDELVTHAQVKDEIFYPAARGALDDPAIVDELIVAHADVNELIAELETSDPSEPDYDTRVAALREHAAYHAHREEDELYPRLARSDMALDAIGDELELRRAELQAMQDPGLREPGERYPAGPSL